MEYDKPRFVQLLVHFTNMPKIKVKQICSAFFVVYAEMGAKAVSRRSVQVPEVSLTVPSSLHVQTSPSAHYIIPPSTTVPYFEGR